MLCDADLLGDDAGRRVYVEGTALLATSPEFADQAQLRDLLATIEERDRLVTLLTSFIEAPEPVHVELGVKEITSAGRHLAMVTAPFMQGEQSRGTIGILGPMRMHYERVITAVAFMAEFFSRDAKGS